MVGREALLKEFVVARNQRDVIVVAHHFRSENFCPVKRRAGVVISLEYMGRESTKTGILCMIRHPKVINWHVLCQ